MTACSLCGATPARHHHVADLADALARTPAADVVSTVVDGETQSFRHRLPPDAVTSVCDACLPAYDAAHPAFPAERAARAAWEAFLRTLPADVTPADAVRRYGEHRRST